MEVHLLYGGSSYLLYMYCMGGISSYISIIWGHKRRLQLYEETTGGITSLREAQMGDYCFVGGLLLNGGTRGALSPCGATKGTLILCGGAIAV